jgi:tetratricopeptide (TPR) repeat protein
MVQQKNRVKGEYSNDCFLFGLIDDPEFSMQREMFSTPCAGSETLVMRWKVGNRFETSWNAAQIVGAGAPAELTRVLQGTRFLAIQSDVQAAAIGSASAPPDPITALDAAIAANPDDAAVLSRRGQMLVLKGSFSRAIVDFDAVLKLKPNDPEAYNNRCWANAILGDLRTALHDCDAALAVRPSYADALDSRGFVNLKMGEPARAMTDYDAALRLNPRQASSLYGRGVAKVKMGRAQEGQRDISAAKALQANIADEFANLGVH